jgi:site-specific recombinase XerD
LTSAITGLPDDFVFGPRGYWKAFECAKKLAGPSRDVVFHSLRHTYISRLVLAGVEIRTVQELAGYKSVIMTMRYASRI